MPNALATCFDNVSISSYFVTLVKFDIHIIITLENLLGVGSLGGFISHLTHHHAIFPTFLNGLNIPSIV
jgi:hypothetical protein